MCQIIFHTSYYGFASIKRSISFWWFEIVVFKPKKKIAIFFCMIEILGVFSV